MMRFCSQLEIDTKDICLLCMESSVDINFVASSPSLLSIPELKHLIHYLKVDPKNLFNCSPGFLQSINLREDIDLKITTCGGCSMIIKNFNYLFLNFDQIEAQLKDCIQSLYRAMRKGNGSLERVRKYNNQMLPKKSADLVNASIAYNLREKLFRKCFLKLGSGMNNSVRVAVQYPVENNWSTLPRVGEFGRRSAFANGKSQVLEQKHTQLLQPQLDNLKRYSTDPKDLPVPTIHNADDNDAEHRKATTEAAIDKCLTPELQTSSEASSDIEVVAILKPVTGTMGREKGIFKPSKSKLKGKLSLTSGSISTITAKSGKSRRPRLSTSHYYYCHYCKKMCGDWVNLHTHLSDVHPEQQAHGIAQQCRGLFFNHWEVMLNNASASSSNFGNQEYGNYNRPIAAHESNESLVSGEMDIEIEEQEAFENPAPENFDFNPSEED